MTKYLFDSGILSAYIDRRQGVHEMARTKASEGHRIGTCLPVLAEELPAVGPLGSTGITPLPRYY